MRAGVCGQRRRWSEGCWRPGRFGCPPPNPSAEPLLPVAPPGPVPPGPASMRRRSDPPQGPEEGSTPWRRRGGPAHRRGVAARARARGCARTPADLAGRAGATAPWRRRRTTRGGARRRVGAGRGHTETDLCRLEGAVVPGPTEHVTRHARCPSTGVGFALNAGAWRHTVTARKVPLSRTAVAAWVPKPLFSALYLPARGGG